MRVIRRCVALTVLLILVATPAWPVWSMQDADSIVAHADGTGLLKLGDEEFKISVVVIKLFKDGKAEISLVSELTIFVSGTWAWEGSDQKAINLKITGGATGGGVDATGKLTLREGQSGQRRGIDRVQLQGQSKTTHRNVSLNFQAAS